MLSSGLWSPFNYTTGVKMGHQLFTWQEYRQGWEMNKERTGGERRGEEMFSKSPYWAVSKEIQNKLLQTITEGWQQHSILEINDELPALPTQHKTSSKQHPPAASRLVLVSIIVQNSIVLEAPSSDGPAPDPAGQERQSDPSRSARETVFVESPKKGFQWMETFLGTVDQILFGPTTCKQKLT